MGWACSRASRERWIALVLVIGVPGCVERIFSCRDDGDCNDGAHDGVCAQGYCAFADDDCATGFAYGDRAPAELAGMCVADLEPSNDASSTGGSSPASTDAEEDDTIDPSTAPVDECPEGDPCIPDDPCASAGRCSTSGVCVPTELVECADPPSPCHDPAGVCGALGACEYAPMPSGTDCDDGDPCSVGDVCDGEGECTPGPECPMADPCLVPSCGANGCTSTPVPDGTSCGDQAKDRCCGGTCVDISSDTAHCGGCNTPCWEGFECESISATSTCEVAPEATSGRCTCAGTNSQCPLGQLCRTYEPYTNRCVPPSDDNCDGVRVSQNSCPTFCSY